MKNKLRILKHCINISFIFLNLSEEDSKKYFKENLIKSREKMIKKIANYSKENQESELQKNSKIYISSK